MTPALLLIIWRDAFFDLDFDQRRSDYLIQTVGFLVAEDSRFLSIAQELLPPGEGFRAVSHIPISSIEIRLTVREPL